MATFRALPTFKHSINSLQRYFREGVSIALPVVFLVAIVELFIGVFNPKPESPEFAMAMLLDLAVTMFAIVDITVAWQRFILLDERRPLLGFMRFDRRVWRYFIRLLGISLLTCGCLFVPFAILQLALPFGILVALFIVPLYALMLAFSMGLPAIATDGNPIRALDGPKLFKGSVQELLFYAFLQIATTFGIATLGRAVVAGAEFLSLPVFPILAPFIEIPFKVVSILLAANLLTTLYGVVVERRTV